MINIFLCDDNEIILEQYRDFLSKVLTKENINFNIKSFLSADSLIFDITNNEVDIIYLDIEMGITNGIDVAKQLREKKFYGEIIFLTSCPEYVFESFDVNPLHYIVKNNITPEKFRTILLKAINNTAAKKKIEYFDFERKGIIKKIPIDEISFFEVKNRIITVNFNSNFEDFYLTMATLEKQIANRGFIRCHRSYMVNVRYIKEIERTSLKTIDGYVIPVGKKYLQNVQTLISEMLSNF